jgi:peptide/nickel transport system substrate-binding protein
MVPNSNFEGPKLYFDRLIFKFLDTQGASLQQVEAGDLDMANAPLAFWAAIQNLPGLHLVPMPPSLSYDEMALNFRNPHVAFFRDVRVRQAMADAIDQKEIIKVIFHGQGAEARGPAPTTPPTFLSPEMRAGIYPVSYDPAKSRALLQAAGFTPGADGIMQKNGQRLSFVYLLPQGDATTDLVGIFEQAAMKKIGIDLRIQNIEFNQMLALLVSGGTGWEAAGLGETLGGYPSGEYLFKTGSAENSGGYSDKTMDKLIDSSTNEPGLQGLFDYENYASAQQPVIFEQHTAQPILANDRIHGVENFVDPAGNYYPDQLYCTANNTVAIK